MSDLTILNRPGGRAKPAPPTLKRWGQEETFFNEEYCCKKLTILPNKQTSSHFHIVKHETLYVTQGCLTIHWQDRDCNEKHTFLPAGSAFIIPPGMIHRLSAKDSTVIVLESSTFDNPEDSIRVNY